MPREVTEVARCLQTATEHRIPVYPISRGRNWGYGSRVAHVDQSVILDLSRLDAIRDFNEELGYITVEPGVTQDQVLAFLREHRSSRILNHPASLGGISLLGNLLDRGFAVFSAGPYENRSAHFCNLEVVTARGEVFRTGVGRYPGAPVAPLDDWGVGPQLQGMFIQSNLGVVTSATLWLAPKAKYPQHFGVSVDGPELPQLLDALRRIRHEVSPQARFLVMNRYRYAAHMGTFPWKLTGGRTPLAPDEVRAITANLTGDWSCVGQLHCASRLQRAAEVRLVKKYLGPLARRVNFLNADSAALAKRLWWIPRLVTGTDPRPMVNVFYEGKQVREYDTQLAWNQISWRKKSSSRDEHDLDGSCGIYWFFPMIPWQGHRIREALEACSEIMLTAGFEPNLGIRFPTDRTVLLACYIGFDREIDGEDERSFACYKQMTTRMASDGYYPYRPGIQGMDLLPPSKDDATTVLQRIKHALDPSDILAHPE